MKPTERIIYISIIFLCFIGMYNGCTKHKQLQGLLISVNDTLTKTINKHGQEKTTRDFLLGSIKDLKAMHVANITSIGKLQKLVNRLTISATYLSNVTANSFAAPTQHIIAGDTIKIDSITYMYPEYKTTYANKWERFKVVANKDTTKIDYKVFNEFELVQDWKRNGLFKRKTAIATVRNLNPHTETKEFQTFTVKEDKGNRLRDMLIGAALGALTIEAVRVFNAQFHSRIR